MKRMIAMIKQFLIWIGAAALLLFSVACKQEIGADYQEPNDVERLYISVAENAEEATATPASVPDGRYVWDNASNNGNLTIHVDATVTVPERPLYVTRFMSDGFRQEQITGLFNHLFAGKEATTTVGYNYPTKAELREQIANLKRQLEEGTYDTQEFTAEEFQSFIDMMEASIEDALEKPAEVIPADGTMQTMYNEVMQSEYQMLSAVCAGESIMRVDSYPATANSAVWSECWYNRINEPYYNMLEAIEITDNNALPDHADRVSYSYAEAKALADGVVASTGVPAEMQTAYLINDMQNGHVDGIVRDAEAWAYKFIYQRTVDGVPIAVDAWDSSAFVDEKMEVIIDSDGIANFLWKSPLTLTADSVGGGQLLPFDDAREIFESTAVFTYADRAKLQGEKVDHVEYAVDVNDVRLCYVCITEQESGEGLIVPAWIFYGDITHKIHWKDGTVLDLGFAQGGSGQTGSQAFRGPTIVFAINAVDGSVIDVAQGY